MRHSRVVRISIAAAAAIAALLVAGVASAATITKNIPSAGTFAVPNAPAPQAGVSGGLPEIDPASLDADPLAQGATVNRGDSGGRVTATAATATIIRARIQSSCRASRG